MKPAFSIDPNSARGTRRTALAATLAGLLALTGQASALTYVDATLANTTLADGTALDLRATQSEILSSSPPQWVSRTSTTETANGHWHIRQTFGNGAELFACAANTASPFANTAPTLKTTISGLNPGETYELSVYFWVAGSGAPVGNQEWDLRAGLDPANLTAIRHNSTGSLRLDTSTVVFSNPVVVTEADRRLFRYVLGTATADAEGKVAVYAAPNPGNDDRTWYDGVGFASTAPPPPLQWTGAATQAQWSLDANWDSAKAPVAGDTLVFGSSTVTESVNDLPVDTKFGGLQFSADAAAHDLSGNRFALGGPIVNPSPTSQLIRNALRVDEDLSCNLITGGLTLDGVLSGKGGLVKSGSGLLTLAGANSHTGMTTVQSGPALVSGDQTAATGGWRIGPETSAATTVSWDANSVLAMSATGGVRIGDNKGSLASSLAVQRLLAAGNVTNDGALYLGLQGYLDLTGAASWRQNGPLTVEGFTAWNAVMTVLDQSVFHYAATTPVVLKSGTFQVSRGRINLIGGTFVTGQPFVNGSPETLRGLVTLSWDGTVRLSADVADLAPGNDLVLGGGNGVIDTGAFQTTVGTALTGPGNLVKDGSGGLTLAAAGNYQGSTIVRAGSLTLTQPGLSDTATVDLAAGARLKLDFSGGARVGALILDGTVQAPGVYNSNSHPAYFLAASGSLTVPASSFTEWASLAGLSGGAAADADADGLADAVEYVLGLDPKAADASPVRVANQTDGIAFEFTRDDAAETPDVSLAVEVTDNPASWPTRLAVGPDTATSGPGVTVTENGVAPDLIRVVVQRDGASKRFVRLKVDVTP